MNAFLLTEFYVPSYLLFYFPDLALVLKHIKKKRSPEMMTVLARCLIKAANIDSLDEFSSFSFARSFFILLLLLMVMSTWSDNLITIL